jgi:hypothetical protein
LIVPRQNGKGVDLEARQIVGLYLVESDRLIIHTAHQYNTAQESFARLATLIEDSPLRHRLARNGITTGNGKEGVKLKDGSRVKFLTRSPKSGRGFTSDLLIYDEAMAGITPRMVGASGPTMRARPNPQTIYTATAGNEESEVLAGVRDAGIAGSDPRLAYVEYSAGDPDDHVGEDVDLDDRAEYWRSNPAMWGPNPRITEEDFENDRAELDDENFAREILCLWWIGKRVALIRPDVWKDLEGTSTPTKKVSFAVDIPPERDSAVIAVASDLGDGKRHWEIVDRRNGTKWVVDRVVELHAKWKPSYVAVAPQSPAGSLIDEIADALEKKRVKVLKVSGADLKAACGQFVDKVNDGLAVVQPNYEAELAAAVDALRKREYEEGGFTFLRKDAAADISPAMAVVLASYAVGKPGRKGGSWAGSKVPCKCGCGAMTETGFATKACKKRFEESDAA